MIPPKPHWYFITGTLSAAAFTAVFLAVKWGVFKAMTALTGTRG